MKRENLHSSRVDFGFLTTSPHPQVEPTMTTSPVLNSPSIASRAYSPDCLPQVLPQVQTLLGGVNLSDPERRDDYIIYIIHIVYLNIQQSEIHI